MSPKSEIGGAEPPERNREMLTVDARCTMRQCADRNIYRMVGRCANCGAEPVLVLITEGHEAPKVDCPKCGVNAVRPTRLATDDEIPVDAVEERERARGMDCAECGQHVEWAGAFHPFLYCLLYKNGVRDQEKYLRDSGFVRARPAQPREPEAGLS